MTGGPPLFHVMAKPPPDLRAAIHRLPHVSPERGPELLHWTVMPLGALAAIGCGTVTLIEAFDEVAAGPFTLVFDRIVGRQGGVVALTGGRQPRDIGKLRAALHDMLQRAGAGVPLAKAKPHVTLDYGYRGADFREDIAPIRWDVDHLLLVESMTGKKRHVHLRRWPLVPRQGTLFPLRGCDLDAARRPAYGLERPACQARAG